MKIFLDSDRARLMCNQLESMSWTFAKKNQSNRRFARRDEETPKKKSSLAFNNCFETASKVQTHRLAASAVDHIWRYF